MNQLLLTLFLAGLLSSTAWAVPVNPNAADGIAAVYPLYGNFVIPHVFGNCEAAIFVLGTDGNMYISQYGDYRGDFMHKWHLIKIAWPVPFEEIVDWIPTWEALPPVIPGHPRPPSGGIIRTRMGEHWAFILDWRGSWDTGGPWVEKAEWKKWGLGSIKSGIEK